jgi:hypothetical protein
MGWTLHPNWPKLQVVPSLSTPTEEKKEVYSMKYCLPLLPNLNHYCLTCKKLPNLTAPTYLHQSRISVLIPFTLPISFCAIEAH